MCTTIPWTSLLRELDLAEVDTSTDVEAELLHVAAGRERAAHRVGRPVEDREEAIAGGVDLTSAVRLEQGADHAALCGEEPAPPHVAHLPSELGRAHDVGEQHRS